MEALKKSKKQIDMTEGPLLGKMTAFILPLLATNLLQAFYSSADMMVVSLSSEPNAVGAIGTTGSLTALILNFVVGFSIGGTVVVAKRLGAKDEEGAARATHTTLLTGVVMGFFMLTVGLIFSRPLLVLMGAKENLLDLAMTYTRFYFIGAPFTVLTNFVSGVYRAKGDTRTPLYVLTGTGLLNVGLNLFFVLAMGLSVEGVALATAISKAVSAVILLALMARDTGPCRFSFKRLRFDKTALCEIIAVGMPSGLQSALFALSNMLIQSSILQVNNALTPAGETFQPVMKGNSAAANLGNFLGTGINSIQQATVSFTGQNAGAKEYRRVWRVIGCGLAISTAVSLVLGYGIILLRRPLLALYGVREAEEGTLAALAYQTACTRFRFMLTTYFLDAWLSVSSGVLRGLGKSFTSTVTALIGSCLFRVVWLLTVFRARGTLESIYVSYPLSWGITAAFLLLFCVIVLRRRIREQEATVV